MNDQADEGQRRASRNDAAKRIRRTQRRRHRSDRGDQGERGTQVRGQTTRRNQEKQQRADRGEKKRRRRRETRQQRNKERRTKHRDHMLGANANGARPRQPLTRKDDVTGINRCAVTVKLPTEQRSLRFAHARTNPIS